MKTAIVARACLVAIVSSFVFQSSASADFDTSPYVFADQSIASSGLFEWDEFSGFVNPGTQSGSVDLPDVAMTGGNAAMSFSYAANPMDGPPFPLFTSTQNIYAGGTFVDYTVDLSSLDTTNSNSTVVAQFGVLGAYDSGTFLLNGIAPTEFQDRGVLADVIHDTDNNAAAFDTTYYWAEWQVGASSDYSITFSSGPHQSLAQFRVDVFNTVGAFNASAPGSVPEPGSLALLGLMAGVLATRRRRCN